MWTHLQKLLNREPRKFQVVRCATSWWLPREWWSAYTKIYSSHVQTLSKKQTIISKIIDKNLENLLDVMCSDFKRLAVGVWNGRIVGVATWRVSWYSFIDVGHFMNSIRQVPSDWKKENRFKRRFEMRGIFECKERKIY